jgi:hypothetical protein
MCAHDGSPPPPSNPPFPWSDLPDATGCNFAYGHLVRNLEGPITKQGRLQAETLMTAAGAVAGWGAQRSLVAVEEFFQQAQDDGSVTFVDMKDGGRMMYGDALNNMLVGNGPHTAPRCVWNLLVGTALNNRLERSEIPDLEEMFAHVTKQVGGPREGFPSTPEAHQPLGSAGEILGLVLPTTTACLTGEIDSITKERGFRAEPSSYQMVTAWVAANILARCCSVMPPKMALIVGMEAAIYGSKVLPPSVLN